jgi:hypothetical protein
LLPVATTKSPEPTTPGAGRSAVKLLTWPSSPGTEKPLGVVVLTPVPAPPNAKFTDCDGPSRVIPSTGFSAFAVSGAWPLSSHHRYSTAT